MCDSSAAASGWSGREGGGGASEERNVLVDMSPSRSILLVGEGNFSFSSSVCGSESGSIVTATCPQRQEEALRHEGAAANVLNIKDSGGAVLFEVDCTKLGECPPLQGRVFDRVVFNFPHCGRKSGVKKNRELLRNFFLSCVQVLAEDGEVHVSLCNGQGGTPMDQPRRERHNSWQVVAMAAEAHLILSAVCPFESDNHQSYKCTGYRSQDKGFHVEKALLHVFARSAPYTPVPGVHMEEVVDGEKVHYNVPSELSDHLFRKFLCSDSIHPVKLVQDFLLAGLAEDWSVSMTAESESYLVAAKRLQTCCHGVDASQFCWIHQLQRDLTSPAGDKDPGSSNAADASGKASRTRGGAESVRPAFSLAVNPEVEGELYLLRPSLLLQLEELLTKREEIMDNKRLQGINEGNKPRCEAEINKDEAHESCNGISGSLFGCSGVVFRSVPVSLWALPAFHQLLLGAVVPSHTETVKKLGHKLEKLLAPYGVSMVTEDGGLRLTAQPMGLVGQVFVSDAANDHVTVTASLNLDLLAALLFSLPDWRLLWCHDSRFTKQFSLPPPPGTPFRPFSLFPESFSFDVSFWSGPAWEEKLFHAAVREASHGTVEQVKLVDTFSHPDLSQTSFCYRLTYRSHTHAVSHTQALTFHKQLQLLLASRLQLAIR